MQAVTPWPVTDPFLQLSGARLKGALIAGAGRVLAKRDDLNRINVFPVPDGDTGTNLAFTMLAVLKTTRRLRGADLGLQPGELTLEGARRLWNPALPAQHPECLRYSVLRPTERRGEVAHTDSRRPMQTQQDLKAVRV